jgi:hypothetical protein
VVPVNQWSHVAVVVVAQSAKTLEVSFFVNGHPAGSGTVGAPPTPAGPVTTLQIGCILVPPSFEPFAGDIDEVQISSGASPKYTGDFFDTLSYRLAPTADTQVLLHFDSTDGAAGLANSGVLSVSTALEKTGSLVGGVCVSVP